jgi:ATP-dependent DNA helicase RecG
MDEISLRQELLKGEDSSRQFKRQITEGTKLAAEVAAFLNSEGGRIYVGVADDGSISGLTAAQLGQLNQLISNVSTHGLQPPAAVLTENVVTSDGTVLVIRIEEGDNKPYQTNDGFFWVKRGADKRKVTTRSELARLFQHGHAVYAELCTVPGSSIAELDLPLFANFYQKKFGSIPPEDDSLERELAALKLLVDDRLSVAGALLFGRNPQRLLPSFTVKAVWFRGNERASAEYYDNRRFDGTIAEQYEQAMAFCRRWNSRIQTSESFNSPSTPEVPDVVFEELLTNALVHRDYFIQDSIKLFMFDNRIEIRSPGRLPNSLTIEQMRRGVRRDRNPLIASFGNDLMQYRGLGSGLVRAIRLVPNLRIDEDVEAEEVAVTIPLPVLSGQRHGVPG